MPLRVRFFLWISSIFFLVMVLVYVFGEYEVIKEMRELRAHIRTEVIRNLISKKKNYESFFQSRMIMNEAWVNSNLESFRPWMTYNFLPNKYNLDTSSWISLSQTLVIAPWMDFLQCRIGNKLTASIITQAPFVHDLLEIRYSDNITFFIGGHRDMRLSLFVGVPYWDMKDLVFKDPSKTYVGNIGAPKKHWLLYDVGRLLNLKESDFHLESIVTPVNPFQLVTSSLKDEVYFQMLKKAKSSILQVRQALLQDASLLKILKSSDRGQWIKRELEKHFSYDKDEIKKCVDDLCSAQEFVENNELDRSYLKQSDNQVILSRLIWQYNMMTGHKFLNTYNPLSEKMPNGLVQIVQDRTGFVKSIGSGFFAKNVFKNVAMPIKAHCDIDANSISCLKDTNEILFDSKNKDFYIIGTMFIKGKDSSNETAISLGVHLRDILQVMALYSKADNYLLHDDKLLVGAQKDGSIIAKKVLKETKFQFREKLAKDVGFSINEKGEKFLYMELHPFKDDSKTILCIEYHDLKYFDLFTKFSENTEEKLYHVSLRVGLVVIIGFLIGLFIIDRVIRNITIPIQSLAKASHMIGLGKLDYLKLMDVKSMHHDEIGKLYEEFMLMVEKMKRGRRVESILNKVVSKEIGEEILKRGKINLKGELRRGTVLFADMVKCTELSQEESPIDFLQILNQSFGVLSRVIEDHHGVIDKYIGDAVMSLFGIPIEDDHQELHATLSGLEMIKMIDEMNLHRKNLGQREVKFGIGIHTGEVVAGNIGAKSRLNYTVVGYPVNSAARICNYAKGGEVLISKEVAQAPGVKEAIEIEFHSEITLKGMFKPIKLYRAIRRK